jgi:hypothetical protein
MLENPAKPIPLRKCSQIVMKYNEASYFKLPKSQQQNAKKIVQRVTYLLPWGIP